ncbi:MAG: hypothetical protein KAU28_07015, partial [Phycisphaerae bacterium]|nr:hypothetical protein [Phycisphaerae bacterium]
MKHAGTNRGSALLLVVGLLTIIAMLGSTFLIASHLESQQAIVITITGPIPPLTNGVFSELQQVLKFDEYLAADLGKFGQLSRIPNDWKKFVDMPGKAIDPYLTDISTEQDPWWSKVFGEVDDYGKVDTDGDGEDDAWLYNVRVMNSKGDIYYMALRVVDLSGLMCINTAGDREATFLPKDPAMVDLKSYLGEDTYNELAAARSGRGSSALEAYARNCGRRMLSPVSGYRPFAFADEVVLRWRASSSTSERSKLYEILQDQGEKVMQLTTFSSSQSILRYPGMDEKERARILVNGPDVLAARLTVGELDNSLRLYSLMKDAMGSPDAAAATPLIKDNPLFGAGQWTVMTDNPNVYGKNYLQNPADADKGSIVPLALKCVNYSFAPDEDGDYVVSGRAPKSNNSAPAVA